MTMPELNEIYMVDCFEGFKRLKDSQFNLVLTSPPFKDEDISGPYYKWLDRFIRECKRVSEIAVVFNSSRRLVEICKRYEPDRVLIWNKTGTRASYKFEPIFIFADHGHNVISARPTDKINVWADIISVPPLNGEQYRNPTKLYTQILRYFPWAQNVLDPCMGWGTTAMSARQLGKDFMGFEKDIGRVEFSKQRLQQERLL